MTALNRPIKVFLVDDEEKTRKLLKLLIDWEKLGFRISGEASSGQEGLYLLEEIQPDLIITDVRMPYMDGLQFSKLALQMYPNVKIIILTAYEDFSCAQQSIQIGVSDFLLKPIKRDNLMTALNSVVQKIEEEMDMRQEYSHVQEQLGKMQESLKEKFLGEMLVANSPNEELRQKMQYFSMECMENQVQAAVITLQDESAKLNGEKRILYSLAGADLVRQYFQGNAQIYVFTDHLGNIVIADADVSYPFEAEMEKLKDILSAKLFNRISAGVGTVCTGLHGLAKSYREACEALKYCIIYGDKIVLSYKDVSLSESSSETREKGLEEIEFFVRAGLRKETSEAVRRSLVQQPLEAIEDINAIKVKSINIVTLLLNIATEMHFPLASQKYAKLYQEVISFDKISQIESELSKTAENLASEIQNVRKKKSGQQIATIMEYIDEHLSDPALGLSSLSSHFFINPSYLSRTFKHQTGTTIVEYLTTRRIRKAQELLQNTDRLAYEIGAEVGIPDPNYFGKCFKKYTGYSIQEFRKKSADLPELAENRN